ncbi:hypothetical protein F4604DRAFT_1927664 [Suillus subluteus]|nr:hypothetical protein F4604DRAFT_1927664 [Suillus subluteus]
MSSSIRRATSASFKDGEAPPSPRIYSHEAQTLTSGLSSTPGPMKNTTSKISGSLPRKKTLSTQGDLNSKNIQIGTPRAMGALFSVKNTAAPKFSITIDSDCKDCKDHKDSLSESTDSSNIDRSSEELKAQLVLNATRAQRDVCLMEKTLADCILKENAALGKLYKFEATEAERKLEDADIDIGFFKLQIFSSHFIQHINLS